MIINRKKSVHKKNSIDEYKLSKKKNEEATIKGMISKWTSWDRQKANQKKENCFPKS